MARSKRGGNRTHAHSKPRSRPGAKKRRGEPHERFNAEHPRASSKQHTASKSMASNTPLGFERPRNNVLKKFLADIGTPDPKPFAPDAFQIEALAAIEHEDVLVTAPTGAGKTWIAREEIRRLLVAGKRAWYTSPLKALTNSKYQEFGAEFGASNVGILTGDRKENADAPIIVGTTEIYRNQLFDALRGGNALDADLIVMDEAHYLADEERGHVWEEAIILTPPRVRLLLLSATIGNAREFASWIAGVRGTKCGVVTRRGEDVNETNDANDANDPNDETSSVSSIFAVENLTSRVSTQTNVARPVPLRAAFLSSDGELVSLFDEHGKFNAEVSRWQQREQKTVQMLARANARSHHYTRRKPAMPEMPPSLLLNALGSYDLLPAIVFLPTRRRCDEAAMEAALTPFRRHKNAEARERAVAARQEMLQNFINVHPEIRKHRHLEMLVRGGVASHHAGHLPAWKLAIEQLMSAGLLDAIFATATVAAGVDFPARTVALTGVEVRRGGGWRTLTASEFQQMTGRAGRRGRDKVGFIVAASGAHQDPNRVATLLKSQPDALESQFRATYTTLLNLLDAFGNFAQVREIIERSFAHRATVTRIAQLERTRRKLVGDESARIKLREVEQRIETLRYEIWSPFERLARVLARFGYLDLATETVTERGRWLADLRVDRPLLIGEALQRGLFDKLDAPRAAALIAALTADSERDYGSLEINDTIMRTLTEFERIAFDVGRVEWEEDLEVAPEINFSAAAATARWAQDAKWTELVRQTRAEEGDLFRMLSRTGESLLQIARLRDTHEAAARIAANAAASILREPVREETEL